MVNLYNHHLNQTAYRFKYCALNLEEKIGIGVGAGVGGSAIIYGLGKFATRSAEGALISKASTTAEKIALTSFTSSLKEPINITSNTRQVFIDTYSQLNRLVDSLKLNSTLINPIAEKYNGSSMENINSFIKESLSKIKQELASGSGSESGLSNELKNSILEYMNKGSGASVENLGDIATAGEEGTEMLVKNFTLFDHL